MGVGEVFVLWRSPLWPFLGGLWQWSCPTFQPFSHCPDLRLGSKLAADPQGNVALSPTEKVWRDPTVCVCIYVCCLLFPSFLIIFVHLHVHYTCMWYIVVLFTLCDPLVLLPFTTNFPPSPPAATCLKKMTPLLQLQWWGLRRGLERCQFLFSTFFIKYQRNILRWRLRWSVEVCSLVHPLCGVVIGGWCWVSSWYQRMPSIPICPSSYSYFRQGLSLNWG